MKKSRPGRLTLATLSLTSMALAQPVLAQDGPGLVGTLSFSQGVEASDNADLVVSPDGTDLTTITRLGFALSSETRSEQFSFSLGTAIEGDLGTSAASNSFRFASYSARAAYGRSGANSDLVLSARLTQVDIEDDVFGFFVDGEFDPDALVIDGGTRTVGRIDARYRMGLEGPFGLELRTGYVDVAYDDTSDPSLESNKRSNIDAVARFRLNPAVTARAIAGIAERKEDDATNTERNTSYVGAGIETELASGLEIEGDITFDKTERTELGSVVSDDSGVGLSLSASQPRPDGSIGARLTSRVDQSGRRTTASVRRSYDLPNGGLTLSLGVTEQEDEDVEVVTSLRYSRDTDTNKLRANIVQRPTTSGEDGVLNTSISLGYQQDINSISAWDAGFSYGSASVIGGSSGDTRTSATIGYTRDLTEDWNVRAGVRHTRIDDDGGADRSSNTVFFSVGRDFSFGF